MTTELESPVLTVRLYATMGEIEVRATTLKGSISILINKIDGKVWGDKRYAEVIAQVVEGIARDIREFA